MSRTTYQDLIDHLADYLGAGIGEREQRDCRRAASEAMRDLANSFRWSYLLTQGRVLTQTPYQSGTIAYLHSSGAYPRQVALTTTDGTTFPAWSVGGSLRVGDQVWKVAQRIDGHTLALDAQVNPGIDVASGTSYSLYLDTYVLPQDFIAQDQALYERNFGGMEYVHPREWLFEQRFLFSQGTPQWFTVTGDALFPGRLVMRVAPYPVEQKTIDFLYHRRPREMRLALSSTGTASVAGQSNVVNASVAAFSPSMVGSVIRLSDSAQKPPTAPIGSYPAAFESTITGYVGATQVVVADESTTTLGSVLYTVSDAIDIEEGAMLNAFFRGSESCLANLRTLKDKPDALALYRVALAEAKAADSRSFAGRYVGDNAGIRRQRLVDMPFHYNTTQID